MLNPGVDTAWDPYVAHVCVVSCMLITAVPQVRTRTSTLYVPFLIIYHIIYDQFFLEIRQGETQMVHD